MFHDVLVASVIVATRSTALPPSWHSQTTMAEISFNLADNEDVMSGNAAA